MDGYELARRLRVEPKTKHAILIALTGYGQESDARKSRLNGIEVHLTKPVDPTHLQNLLGELANRLVASEG
jgi:CheY-like chemotaxis protein